jgi:hypothetical protein
MRVWVPGLALFRGSQVWLQHLVAPIRQSMNRVPCPLLAPNGHVKAAPDHVHTSGRDPKMQRPIKLAESWGTPRMREEMSLMDAVDFAPRPAADTLACSRYVGP